ncbi:MAG: hypothetical protein ACNA7W_08425 [Pseudomonadales bacterium]
MLTLSNDALVIQLLDPAKDRDRLGVRYCAGGYIFQITDPARGDLLSGPTFPTSFNCFDGQGIPDSFRLGPLASKQRLHEALVIGVGVCDLAGNEVLEFSDWTVEAAGASVVFSVEQRYEEHAIKLVRTVSLHGRTVRSHTCLRVVGQAFAPVRWFPHPFFPHPQQGDELLWVNAPLRWRDAAGYVRHPSGFIARTAWPWRDGRYLALDHDASAPLVVLQRHPLVGLVAGVCSYVPDYFAIWGNQVTMSWEPFLERLVAPGQELTWWVDYTF